MTRTVTRVQSERCWIVTYELAGIGAWSWVTFIDPEVICKRRDNREYMRRKRAKARTTAEDATPTKGKAT